jgi:hypothetical protein
MLSSCIGNNGLTLWQYFGKAGILACTSIYQIISMTIPSNLRSCKWYFFGFSILLILGTVLLIVAGKPASFIASNS